MFKPTTRETWNIKSVKYCHRHLELSQEHRRESKTYIETTKRENEYEGNFYVEEITLKE